MAEIEFVGVSKLDEGEKQTVNKLSTFYYDKYLRVLGKQTAIKVDVKTYDKEGNRKKFAVHLRTMTAKKTFECDAADWDLARTLHKVFKDMERVIEHQFKVEGHPRNPSVRKTGP